MIWKLYKSLTNEYSAINQDQIFMICDGVAKNMEDETLAIDTNFVVECSDPNKEPYHFEYLGEKNTTKMQPTAPEATSEPRENVAHVSTGKFFVMNNPTITQKFNSIAEAKASAEASGVEHVIIAELKGTLTIKTIKQWED
jgi:hypothetical protein